jgi:hypothetical protein
MKQTMEERQGADTVKGDVHIGDVAARAQARLLFLGCAGVESLKEERVTPCGVSERRMDPSLRSCLERFCGRREQNTSRGQGEHA